MERKLKDIVEEALDKTLEHDSLRDLKRNIKVFTPLFKSEEDVMFGFLIGFPRGTLITYAWAMYGRLPNVDERREVNEMIVRRAGEIKAKISAISREKTEWKTTPMNSDIPIHLLNFNVNITGGH